MDISPRQNDEVINIIATTYDILEPGFGCQLVNPNIVLAVANIKYYADIAWIRYTRGIEDRVREANQFLNSFGITLGFYPYDSPVKIFTGSITSLKGLERITHLSKLPWIVEYNYSEDRKDLVNWTKTFQQNLISAREKGDIHPGKSALIFQEGIRMGYPDQAIIDFEKAVRLDDINTPELKRVTLAYPTEYATTSPIPNCSYYIEHWNHPDIVNWAETANRVFKQFYKSNWYLDISQSKDFITARKNLELTKEEGLRKRDIILKLRQKNFVENVL